MAQKVVLIDDLDGSEAARTVRFSYEGTEYEIDLSEANDADTAEPRRRAGSLRRRPRRPSAGAQTVNTSSEEGACS